MSELTVVIPIHDPFGKEKSRIIRAVNSIVLQKNPPRTLILGSSHEISYLNEIKELVSGKFKVKNFVNKSNGAAANLNFLLAEVSTQYSKILFQDDFLKSDESLETIERTLDGSPKKWLVHGCDHFYETNRLTGRIHRPVVSRSLIRGVNRIGAPSVIAFKNGFIPKFNEEMVYMFDCEWYLRMQHSFGNPEIIKDPLVTIGIHSNQATEWAQKFLQKEIEMTKNLHKVTFLLGNCELCKKKLNS
jgi:hypothetical protein